MKNFSADGRLTSSPPLPPTMHTPSGAPTTTPVVAYTLSLYLLGRSVGEGVGGGEGSRARQTPQLLTQSLHLKYTCGKRAIPFSSSVSIAFRSVSYNSVDSLYCSKALRLILAAACNNSLLHTLHKYLKPSCKILVGSPVEKPAPTSEVKCTTKA